MDTQTSEKFDEKSNASLKRKLLGGGASMLASRLAIMGFGFLTFFYLSRELGPVSYGLYGLAVLIGEWSYVLANALSGGATVQLVAGHSEGDRFAITAMRMSLLTGLILGGLLFLLSPLLAGTLHAPELVVPLRILSLGVPLRSVSLRYFEILVARSRYNESAALITGYWMVRSVLSFLLVLSGTGIWGAVAALPLASLTQAVAGHWLSRVSVWDARAMPLSAFIYNGRKRTFSGVFSRLLQSLDLFSLQWWNASALATGHYAAAKNLAMMVNMVFSSGQQVVTSTLAGMRVRGQAELGTRLEKRYISSWVYLCGLLMCLSVLCLKGMGILLGEKYEKAGPVAVVLIIGLALLLLSNSATVVLGARGERGSMAGMVAVLAVVAVAMYRWIPDAFPALSDGLAYAGVYASLMLVMAVSALRNVSILCGVGLPWRSLAFAGFSAATAVAAGLWFDGGFFRVDDIWTLGCQALAVAAAYGLTLSMLDRDFIKTFTLSST